MIRLNPEQDAEASTAIRWAREKHEFLNDVQAAVAVWCSFRHCFYDYHEYLKVVTQGISERYAEFASAIASYEDKFKHTEGIVERTRAKRRK